MNRAPNFTNNSQNRMYWLLAGLALALTASARGDPVPATIPFSEIGARATAGYQGDALGVTATADGAHLHCGFQKLEGHATSEGLWLESTKPGAAGRLRLSATALSRASSRAHPCAMTKMERLPSNAPIDVGGHRALPNAGAVSVQDKVVRFTRPGLTEEYSVSVDGVRQDFLIAVPPAGGGHLRMELALSGARAEAAAYGARLTVEGSGRALAYGRLRTKDATGRELTAHLEVLSADRLVVSVADANATYPVRIDPTFSDADWVSLNPGLPGANGYVRAIAADGSGSVYVGGDFTFIGTVPANYIAKWDGSAWSALGSGVGNAVFALAVSGTNLYAGGYFTTVGGVPANYVAKWDGSTWSALGSGISSASSPYVHALAVSGGDLYVGGNFTVAGSSAARNVAKWDGSSWAALGGGLNDHVEALAVSGTDLYAGGYFSFYSGGNWVRHIAKWNGTAWSALGSGMEGGSVPSVDALAMSGTDLYAGGYFATAGGVPANYIAKWNGSTWSALGSGMTRPVNALVVSGTDLYAGAGGSAAKWNGSSWSALGSGMNSDIRALAVSGTNLYAGGFFTMAGGVPANYIAKWDGTAWAAWDPGKSGLNGRVYALVVMGTDLYVGGSFKYAGGGVLANAIARWNGSAWSALGSGLGGSVRALAVSGTNLYAGGDFTSAGGAPAKYVAKWNGSSWSALGAGLGPYSYYVNALAVSGSDLYVGGSFTTAGGVPANHVAKWNGSGWSALGSGVSSTVNALAVSGTDLYAGGDFATAGWATANYVAKWDGSSWSALGSGLNSNVCALAVSGSDLYVGGYFTNAGESAANFIAKWDGSSWSALGSGMNRTVYTLAVSGTDLYAGGSFTSAGGVAATNITKWDGNAWSALGSGIDGSSSSVRALAAQGEVELFVGGQFYLAGAKASPYIAEAVLLPGVPTILNPPQTQTAGVGSTAEFRVEVGGPGPLAYQWFFNATNIVSGETNFILQLTDLQLSQSGAYSVIVANAYGSVSSSPALLTVTAAPAIAAPPTNQKTLIGGTAEFSVLAGGILPLAYQWCFNANAVFGATDSTLQLTNVQPWQAGGYTVVVTNAYGATTSAPAVLEVYPPGTVVSASEAALRDAMAATQTVTFSCDGTITLGSPIVISTNTVLDGSGHEITISGSDAVQVFNVLSNVTLTLLSVTIANGRCTNGGGIYNAGNVNASNCAFVGNVAQGETDAPASGGALFNQGWLNLAGCDFTANLALGAAGSACTVPPDWPATPGQSALGGAIASSGTLTADLCTFMQNSARGGVGGLGYDGQPYGWPSYPGADGGAAYGAAVFSSGVLSVSHSTFVGNGAYGGEGGRGGMGAYAVFESGGDGAVGGNGGSAGGSAVFFSAGTVVSSALVSNGAVGGAGGQGGAGGAAMSDVVSPGAGAPGGGGGPALGVVYGGNIANCTLAQNITMGGIGGRGGEGGGPVLPEYPFGLGGPGGAGADGFGGLCYCSSANCTVASNSGRGGTGGAGGFGRIPGADGADGSAGGGAFASTLVNTLLATNSPGGNGFGTLTDLGYNLSSDNTCQFTATGSINDTDPRIGELADNGGPTLTMALLPGSPAIDAGNTALGPATDQRGFPRPAGAAPDIGGYELCYPPILRINPPQAGSITIQAFGTNGQACRLLWSPDLSSWVPLATNEIGNDETVLFYDTFTPGSACRFYRLVMP